jgi:pyruvate, water dikinase
MSASDMTRRFPLPSEIETPAGAEGWEDMYPFYLRFQPEDDERFWFCNSMHFPEPLPAFDGITSEVPPSAVAANTARLFVFPTTLGTEHRIVNGRVYITANPVLDPAEVERRHAQFAERAGHYYEHWDDIYAGWQQRIEQLIADIEAVEVPALPEFDDLEAVTEHRGIAQNHYVREGFHRCIDLFSKMWHHHTELLTLGYGAYVVFFEFCKGVFPEIPDADLSRMVGGVDVVMYRPDDELKRLAGRAVELGVDDLFVEGADPDHVLAALADRGDAGQQWLDALDAARIPWFHVSTGDGFYHHHRSWNDDLTVPFSALPRYVEQVRAGEDLARPTEHVKAERERIAQQYRALLETDEDRAAFDQMLGLCRLVFPYVEDHKFYCEHWFTTQFYAKMREFGALLQRWQVIDDVEDLFHLQHYEVDQALADVMLAWASGGRPTGAAHLKPRIAERKRILDALAGWSPPAALGPVPQQLDNPLVKMLWGITVETLDAWTSDQTAENEVHGYAASPGVVEGTARVLRSVNDIGQIRDGEILVCPVTAPSWGPVFGKIKAAVSDIGGTMSHAAIVAREYGMPAVVGTGLATTRISTGQRLRVDGDNGVVTILDAATDEQEERA